MKRHLPVVLACGVLALAGCSQPADSPYSAGQTGLTPPAEKPVGAPAEVRPAAPQGPVVLEPAMPARMSELSITGDPDLLNGA